MLLTDGSPNTIDELRVYESAVAEVAHTEMIDLTVKLDLSTEEVAQDVLDFLLDRRGADPRAALRRGIGVSDVAVTRQLKRWHAVHALEIFYRDAFNNQLNDRYQEKFREYHRLSKNAREHTFHLLDKRRDASPVAAHLLSRLGFATYFEFRLGGDFHR